MDTFIHTALGYCIWDIPALILLIAMVVICLIHIKKQKKREQEFEEELARKIKEKNILKRKDTK